MADGITTTDEAKFILLCGKSIEDYIDERIQNKFGNIFHNLPGYGFDVPFEQQLDQYLEGYLRNKYHDLFTKILNHHHDIVLNSPVSVPSLELTTELWKI
jgi:hypothetical protein